VNPEKQCDELPDQIYSTKTPMPLIFAFFVCACLLLRSLPSIKKRKLFTVEVVELEATVGGNEAENFLLLSRLVMKTVRVEVEVDCYFIGQRMPFRKKN
jgi:hypothetical protein